jgi:Tfp pilus assembly protein PilF
MTLHHSGQLIPVAVDPSKEGRLPEAGQMYQRILAINPRHPDCLHLLGMIACQEGRLETAATMIRQAISDWESVVKRVRGPCNPIS